MILPSVDIEFVFFLMTASGLLLCVLAFIKMGIHAYKK